MFLYMNFVYDSCFCVYEYTFFKKSSFQYIFLTVSFLDKIVLFADNPTQGLIMVVHKPNVLYSNNNNNNKA